MSQIDLFGNFLSPPSFLLSPDPVPGSGNVLVNKTDQDFVLQGLIV